MKFEVNNLKRTNPELIEKRLNKNSLDIYQRYK